MLNLLALRIVAPLKYNPGCIAPENPRYPTDSRLYARFPTIPSCFSTPAGKLARVGVTGRPAGNPDGVIEG
jgi:hypothetical protein